MFHCRCAVRSPALPSVAMRSSESTSDVYKIAAEPDRLEAEITRRAREAELARTIARQGDGSDFAAPQQDFAAPQQDFAAPQQFSLLELFCMVSLGAAALALARLLPPDGFAATLGFAALLALSLANLYAWTGPMARILVGSLMIMYALAALAALSRAWGVW